MDLWTRDHVLMGQDLENLRQICLFIIGIYYKQWFHIKRDHKLVDGSHHMLRQVQLVAKYCSAKVRVVVDQYITRSSYFAHPELLLISLLTSTNEKDRHFAVKTMVGEKKREGWIRCSEESRKVLKKPQSKADYKALFDFPLD